jgi:ABC-type polysaccharide/polyol phosphate transport system ATPase subunit
MTERSFVITAREIGVQYDLRLTPDRTLRRTVGDFARRPKGADTKFWALRDVGFDVAGGEIVGVIGPNGAGKSTLLLAIAGILRPQRGVIYTATGSTLLTLGAGFEPDLTGRQNILLNAAYLGFSRAKIREQMREIIEFTELGDFIDAPLRTYSTGMRTRLAFSVAVHVEPEIVLLDEVLGVGDAAFQKKSTAKIRRLMAQARAIMVVTHNLTFVREVCTSALWLEDGCVVEYGDSRLVAAHYESAANARAAAAIAEMASSDAPDETEQVA